MHEHIGTLIQRPSARAERRRGARVMRRRPTLPVLPPPQRRAWGELLASPFAHRHPRRATFVAPS